MEFLFLNVNKKKAIIWVTVQRGKSPFDFSILKFIIIFITTTKHIT